MLSRGLLRGRADWVAHEFGRRGSSEGGLALDRWTELDGRLRAVTAEVDDIRHAIKALSRSLGPVRAEGGAEAGQEQSRGRARELAASERELIAEKRTLKAQVLELELSFPNLLDEGVPDGAGSADNLVQKVWGTAPTLKLTRSHEQLGVLLGIMDFERAVKVSGRKHCFLIGAGARLEHALIRFMREHHEAAGDLEVLPPYIVRSAALQGCGQLPKFASELFRIAGEEEKYLIPTAEVPLTSMHSDETFEESELPLRYFAFSPCFRSEAGAAGRTDSGYIRQHVFHKVELVRFCVPGDARSELESMTLRAASLLERLGLHHRLVKLCAGEVGASARMTLDLEVWLPSRGEFLEIASCSDYGTFQAQRANIRYRPRGGGKPRPCHTLNASALAVGRTLVALLEQGQQPDGSVVVPPALVPYFGSEEITPR